MASIWIGFFFLCGDRRWLNKTAVFLYSINTVFSCLFFLVGHLLQIRRLIVNAAYPSPKINSKQIHIKWKSRSVKKWEATTDWKTTGGSMVLRAHKVYYFCTLLMSKDVANTLNGHSLIKRWWAKYHWESINFLKSLRQIYGSSNFLSLRSISILSLQKFQVTQAMYFFKIDFLLLCLWCSFSHP